MDAIKHIHIARRFDPGRNGWYILFRFPYHVGIISDLKAEIKVRKERFWYPSTKAWHIAEKYAELAQEIILRHIDVKICRDCMSGQHCEFWDHLKKDETEPKSYGQRHKETSDERDRAQSRYDDWRWERHRRADAARERRTHERESRERHARAGRNSSNEQYSVHEGEALDEHTRWYDPGGRRQDSRWAMRVLALDSLPTERELKKCFHELALEYHPDKESGDPEKMALINGARDYLLSFISG